jgi:organic radical activating enzyme
VTEIASAYKVTYHEEKLEAYLRNEQILPATLELDITTECTRRCPVCPSTTGPRSTMLDLGFVKRLFARLEGETRGLLLSGGEPTLAPVFPDVLRLARQYGFIDIAVVTNGTLLDREQVAAALCAYASTIRVSIYDWTGESREDLQATFRRIENLRSRVDREGSRLQIGVSALTSKENAGTVCSVAEKAASSGAHWIYFHPMCIRWDIGAPERVDQSGVLPKIRECQEQFSDGFRIFTFADRYVERQIDFTGYHAAHFLLVVGADGVNYLGAEVKYNPRYAIAHLTSWHDDFLWRRERLRQIESVDSRTYAALASRHRGIMYNHVIQNLVNHSTRSPEKLSADTYLFPHIL